MKRMLTVLGAFATAVLVAATAQAATSAPSHNRSSGGVGLRKTEFGSVLVDANGRTLYLFEKDSKGVSMCTGECASYWPPLVSQASPRAGTGVKQALLTLGVRHNGVGQVLYAGHPLYTFVGDKHAGQVTGEGLKNFGAEWYVIGANGRKIDRAADATSHSTTTNPPSYSGSY